MSSTAEEAVIRFPIKFVVDSQNVEEIKDEVDDILGDQPGTTPGDTGKPGMTDEEIEAIEKLTEFIESTDSEGLKKLAQFAKNPSGLVENELLGVLGKAGIYGALATAIITTIIGSPEIIRTIVKALAVKGGPLNQDFHRFFEDEGQIGFSREIQYRKAVGLAVVITNDDRGFLLSDPGFVSNSLVDVEETRAIRLSDKEHVYGYVHGM